MYYKRWNKKYDECQFCGDYSNGYELCSECYQASKEEIIIKNEDGEWIKNVRHGNEYKFYDENKNYYLKYPLLNDYEKRFFYLAKKLLPKHLYLIPELNLQSIIETDTNTRNDELFRNVDFCIFNTKYYLPLVIIEINGQQHYTNEYWKERDKSVKSILNTVSIPIETIDTKDLKNMKDKDLKIIIKNIIKEHCSKKELKNLIKENDIEL